MINMYIILHALLVRILAAYASNPDPQTAMYPAIIIAEKVAICISTLVAVHTVATCDVAHFQAVAPPSSENTEIATFHSTTSVALFLAEIVWSFYLEGGKVDGFQGSPLQFERLFECMERAINCSSLAIKRMALTSLLADYFGGIAVGLSRRRHRSTAETTVKLVWIVGLLPTAALVLAYRK